MKRSDIYSGVRTCIAKTLNCAENEIKVNADLFDDLSCDSFDIIEICMDLEDEFHIKIDDADMEKLKTPQDFMTYIEERI